MRNHILHFLKDPVAHLIIVLLIVIIVFLCFNRAKNPEPAPVIRDVSTTTGSQSTPNKNESEIKATASSPKKPVTPDKKKKTVKNRLRPEHVSDIDHPDDTGEEPTETPEPIEPSDKSQDEHPSLIDSDDIKSYDDQDMWELFHKTMGWDEGWTLVEDKNGVKIYTRKTGVSPIKAFRGTAEVDAGLEAMVAFLADATQYPSYVYLCNSGQMIKQENDAELYFHSVNKPPWPVSKRDTVSHIRWHYDPEGNIARMDSISVPGLIPEVGGHVRVPLLFIQVTVSPKDENRVEIIFEGVCEPGGLIPDWVANFCVKQTPRATLHSIMEKRPFEQYEDKTVGFLTTPPK